MKFNMETTFILNEYFDKYMNLIHANKSTIQQTYKTNKHHIIPRSFFIIDNKEIDNSTENIVNLSIADHILAHYYLALCVHSKYRYAMENAFFHLLNSHKELPTELDLIKNLPMYLKVYEQFNIDQGNRFTSEEKSNAAKLGWENRKKRGSFLNNKPTSKKQKNTASKTFKGKSKPEEQRKKMSKSGKLYHKNHPDALVGKNNPMFGRKRMHLKSDKSISLIVKPKDFEKYLALGYVFNDKNFKFEKERNI